MENIYATYPMELVHMDYLMIEELRVVKMFTFW